MATAPFDTLRVAKILKGAGFDDDQATAIVYAIRDALVENAAAKSEALLTKTDTQTAAKFRADLYRALLIQGGVLVIVMIALFTLFRALE